jgi:hypothetical protein
VRVGAAARLQLDPEPIAKHRRQRRDQRLAPFGIKAAHPLQMPEEMALGREPGNTRTASYWASPAPLSISTDTPEFWPVSASESGPRLLAQ